MNALVFLVQHRAVDLVVMTATHALREDARWDERLLLLRRDDAFVVEGEALGDPDRWVDACTGHAHWFNPNKHRFALYEAEAGALAAAEGGTSWPRHWLRRRVASDRPDLVAEAGGEGDLRRWLALPRASGAWATSLVAYDRDGAVGSLPGGHWPDPRARTLRLVLWTLALRAPDAEKAGAWAEELAIARHRSGGLLIQPHMEGWARPLDPWPLEEGVPA